MGYTFDTNYASNYSRNTQLVYPNGRTVTSTYGYNAYPIDWQNASLKAFLDTLNNKISRVGSIGDAVTPTLETYDYLGLGRIVVLDRPTSPVAVRMSYIAAAVDGAGGGAVIGNPLAGFPAHDDRGSADKYDGLDRFGRVVEHGWAPNQKEQ